MGFDTKSALEIARIINHRRFEDSRGSRKWLPEIALVIDMVARSLRDGGALDLCRRRFQRNCWTRLLRMPAHLLHTAAECAVHHRQR